MRSISHTLVAGVQIKIAEPGRFFMLLETVGPVDVQLMKNRTPTRDKVIGLEAGYKSFPLDATDDSDRFDGYLLKSATNQTIKVGVSDRGGSYDRTVLTGAVEVGRGGTVASVPDVSCAGLARTSVAALNLTRRFIMIGNLQGNSDIVRWVDSAGGAGEGQEIAPGQSLTIYSTDSIKIWNTKATAQSVSVIEVLD